jgi:hypothetical protein
MNIVIWEKCLKIKIDEKINTISDENIIDMFCLISAFQRIETKKGNEYDKAWIKVEYIQGFMVNEYINVFKIIRKPFLYDFVKYFKNIDDKYNSQGSETKLNLDDYFSQINELSQEILIIMVFNIESKEDEILMMSKKIKETLKVNDMDKEIFKM